VAVVAKPSPKSFSTLVFKQIDTAWIVQQELPINGNDIALNADGSILLTSDNTSGAFIYTRIGTLWSEKQKIAETGKGSMSADGSTIMFAGNTAPVVYTRGGTGSWVKQSTTFGQSTGISVALSADGSTGFTGDTRDTSMIPKQNPAPFAPEPVGGPQSLGAVYAFAAGTPITPPAIAATAITFTNTTTNSTTLSWTKGNGTKRAVFMRPGISGYPTVFNGVGYTANPAYGANPEMGLSGWYCVYNGDGTSVNITGLTQAASYIAAVLEYNGDYGAQQYSPQANNIAVVSTQGLNIQASNLTFNNITGTGATANWVNGSGIYRAVFVSKGNSGTPLPANAFYTANTNFGSGSQIGNSGWYCVAYFSGSTVNITGLTIGQTYRVAVMEANYNHPASRPEFIQNDIAPANVTTQVAAPTGYAANLSFSNTKANSTTLSWTSSNGAARAVFLKAGSTGAPAVVQGTTYSANSSFGLGTQVGTNGWYCIYNGTGNTVNITGLSASTTYRTIVLEYNGPAGNEAYNLSRYNQINVTTPAAAGLMMASINKTGIAPENIGGPVVANNILSPNGDGKNDIWIVNNLEFHPNNIVSVVDAGGTVVFSKKGYANDWAGTYKGDVLKEGTYYYTIDLGNLSTLRGFFTVVRDK
jgi:gliding motility-associated-like protein